MALIKIDVTDIIANVTRALPAVSDLAEVRRTVAASALDFWSRQAKEKLKSTSQEYQQALSLQEHGESTWLVLTGVLPNLVENGFSGGNMRDWMLRSPKAKMGKNGMYLTIPFQHGSPGSSGRYVGAPMPTAIHKEALKLQRATQSRPNLTGKPLTKTGGRTVLFGTRLKADMRGMSAQANKILKTLKKPHHTTSIYTGMTRARKTYAKATQTSGYTTFRRISAGGDPASWLHKGIKPARHFAKDTQRHIEENLPFALREAMGGSR
jgi:hypothetical protein